MALRYALAVAITVEITLLRFALDRILNDSSIYSFYYASVVLAAWYLGLGPSLLNVFSGAADRRVLFCFAANVLSDPGIQARVGLGGVRNRQFLHVRT